MITFSKNVLRRFAFSIIFFLIPHFAHCYQLGYPSPSSPTHHHHPPHGRNYRNFDELRNPHLYQFGNNRQPPQYRSPYANNLQTFTVPTGQAQYSVPVSMSMAFPGSTSSPSSHQVSLIRQHTYLPPSSPSLNHHHHIRILHQNPLPPPQARILNSNPHLNGEDEKADTKYLELNLYNNNNNHPADQGNFGLRQPQHQQDDDVRAGFKSLPFYPSYPSYTSRAARKGIVENDSVHQHQKSELPFVTSTFYKEQEKKKPENVVNNELDFFGRKNPDSSLRKDGFVPSPQVKMSSRGDDNNENRGGGNNLVGIGNNNFLVGREGGSLVVNDDGWVGLEGPRLFESQKNNASEGMSFNGGGIKIYDAATSTTTTTTRAPATMSTATTQKVRMRGKTSREVMSHNQSELKSKPGTIGDTFKTKIPSYKTTKLAKSSNNQTSIVAETSSKKKKNRSDIIINKTSSSSSSKSGYSKIRSDTKLLTTNQDNVLNITTVPPITVVHPEKTSASKMPGVPATHTDRGEDLSTMVRNSRKPEITPPPTTTESLKVVQISTADNMLSSPGTNYFQISEATSDPFPDKTTIKKQYYTAYNDAEVQKSGTGSISGGPLIGASAKYTEPKPSPGQVMQFTPNDVRPSFNPNNNFQQGQKSGDTIGGESQTKFHFTPPQQQIIGLRPPTPSAPYPFSTSIPIVSNNLIMPSYHHPQHRFPRPGKNLPHFHPNNHRQARRRPMIPTVSYPPPPLHGYGGQHRPRRMTTLPIAPSEATQFSARSLDLGLDEKNRGMKSSISNKKIVKKSSAGGGGQNWLNSVMGRRDGEEDDSEEELNGGGGLVTDRDGRPIVDPQHPVVMNALNPLGNPAMVPDQLIKKHQKILDPSSLIVLDKKAVIVVIMVGWLIIFGTLFSYKTFGKGGGGGNKGGIRQGWEQELLGGDAYKPLLLNIPKDGTDPFVGTSRAMDVSGPNWGMNFVKVLDYIDIARKNYEGFDWQNLDCQKRVLCELSQEHSLTGETGRKITNNYLLRFVDVLDGLPIPQIIQAYLAEYKEAITEGKNAKKTCNEIYSHKCKFSLTKLVETMKKESKKE